MTFTTSTSPRRRRYAVIHSTAIIVSVASGTFALVAMLVGSPLSFGLALALCGAGWIVTHFVERVVEQDTGVPRRRSAECAEGFADANVARQAEHHRRFAVSPLQARGQGASRGHPILLA